MGKLSRLKSVINTLRGVKQKECVLCGEVGVKEDPLCEKCWGILDDNDAQRKDFLPIIYMDDDGEKKGVAFIKRDCLGYATEIKPETVELMSQEKFIVMPEYIMEALSADIRKGMKMCEEGEVQ